MTISVIKKDGTISEWQDEKIKTAVSKAASRVGTRLSTLEIDTIIERSKCRLDNLWGETSVTVSDIHQEVTRALGEVNPLVQKSYQDYRDYKTNFVKTLDEIFVKTKDTLYFGDRENANFDSSLISTKGSIIRGYLTKELYKNFYLSQEELQLIEDGFIYIHDIRDLIFGGFNCCLFDIEKVLKGGFEMSGIQYQEPKTVLSALQVIGDVVLSATAQQFGGFTLPELDRVLVPYVIKSYKKYEEEADTWGIKDTRYPARKVEEELSQGFQSLEMKLNTVPCSRGDFAFTTISFGNLEASTASAIEYTAQYLTSKAILNTRMAGQGKNHKPVVFPKLVYLHSERSHQSSFRQQKLFNLAVDCCSKAMYPDFLDIDQKGDVARIYNESGVVISPMGCRSYLSEFKDESGKSISAGRANVGVVSLNLPMIVQEAKNNPNGTPLHESIIFYLDKALDFLNKRYDVLADMPCSSNPLAFTQGGMYKGTKQPDERVGQDIVKAFTASVGITALDEVCCLLHGVHLHEATEFQRGVISSIVDTINQHINLRKEEDGRLYGLYGTPAESLCGTQLKQFREKYGIIPQVSDKEYFTNSFHVNVAADVTPLEKQNLEEEFFHSCAGGHIIYSRLSNPDNKLAIKSLVRRGMSKGFYQGVNFDLAICEHCHQRTKTTEKCDHCGSDKISVINRVCGYLGWTKLNGESRMNDAKLAEIQDRKCM